MTSKTSKAIKSTKGFKKSSKNVNNAVKNGQNQSKNKPVAQVQDYSFKVISDDKFRLQSQRVFFTYKHHIPFDQLIEFINNLFPISQYVICHEIGDEHHNYEHTHISIEFDKKIDVRNCRAFDFNFNNEVIHPNIGTTRNWPASCIYCLKMWRKDPNNKNWEANFDVIEYLKGKNRNKCVKECNILELCKKAKNTKSASEFLQSEVKDLRDVVPLLQIYNNKDYPTDPKQLKYLEAFEKNIRKWQADLYNVLDQEPDRRKIYWVVDKIGGQGKSDFCSYVDTLKKPDTCLTIASTGSLRDISDVIRNWMDRGAYPEIILIDLPRTFQERDSVYTLIESVKNGRLTCTKYKGSTLRFYPPHVMIFSNWLPDVTNLSKDRWVILTLKSRIANDNNAELRLIDLDALADNDFDDEIEGKPFRISPPKSIKTTSKISNDVISDGEPDFDDDECIDIDDISFDDDDIKPAKNKLSKTKSTKLVKCCYCTKSINPKSAKDTIIIDKKTRYLCSDKCSKDYDKMMW